MRSVRHDGHDDTTVGSDISPFRDMMRTIEIPGYDFKTKDKRLISLGNNGRI